MLTNLQIATDVITGYLNSKGAYNTDALLESIIISTGNKELLKGHIKALIKIFNNALKELDEKEEN